MIFRRTASGIANLHLLFRVDKVVYCEGGVGTMIDAAGILAGQGEDRTMDIMFWTHIKVFLGGAKRYHFKSVGNKETLNSLAADVVALNIATIIVCRDSDFDVVTGTQVLHANLVYTYGYSWENDICRADVLCSFAQSLVQRDEAAEQMILALRHELEQLSDHLIRWCEIDLAFVTRGKGALFIRSSPIQLFDNLGTSPRINEARARGRFGGLGYRRAPPRRLRLPDADAFRHCSGKTVSHLAYQLVAGHVARLDRGARFSKDLFFRRCISLTTEAMTAGRCPELIDHYRKFASAFD